MVTIGHKTRPLRDGGGKPSPGRLPHTVRKINTISHLGNQILQACAYQTNQDHEIATAADALTYNTDGKNPSHNTSPTEYNT